DRLLAPHEERHHHVREYDDVAQREKGHGADPGLAPGILLVVVAEEHRVPCLRGLGCCGCRSEAYRFTWVKSFKESRYSSQRVRVPAEFPQTRRRTITSGPGRIAPAKESSGTTNASKRPRMPSAAREKRAGAAAAAARRNGHTESAGVPAMR